MIEREDIIKLIEKYEWVKEEHGKTYKITKDVMLLESRATLCRVISDLKNLIKNET